MPRQTSKACIINGEGKSEYFFLRHIHGLYKHTHKHSITIVSPHSGGCGGCPEDVAHKLYIKCMGRSYDYGAILIDSDRLHTPCDDVYKNARARIARTERSTLPKNCRCFISSPCLEGMLLKISGTHPPSQSTQCKSIFRKIFKKDAVNFSSNDWKSNFPTQTLESASEDSPQLKMLLNLFSGNFNPFTTRD